MKNLKVNRGIPFKLGNLFLIAVLSLFGCSSNTFDSKEELLEYIKNEDHGFILKKNINGVDFSLLYKPTDLLVMQDLGEDRSKGRIDSLRDKYKDYMYFNLSMSVNNKELLSVVPQNRNEFGAMVNQLAFGMGEKVHCYTNNKDTIPLTDYVYPRMYGMSNNTSILFVFPKTEEVNNAEQLYFTIEDIGMNTGEVKFKFLNNTLQQEPKLGI